MQPAQFILAFPEFRKTESTLVQSKLIMAAAKMGGPDFSVWPQFSLPGQPMSLSDVAHGYLAAHLLQTSPFGTEMRLDPKDTKGKSVYLEEYDTICQAVAGGFIVAGQGPWAGGTSGSSGQLVLRPGTGVVTVTNGSLNVVFSLPQSMPAGTVLVFTQSQPGALYALAFNMASTISGSLTAPYTGATGTSQWNVGSA